MNHGIKFNIENKVTSYDDTTLFCPAGMQKYKSMFISSDVNNLTLGNIQRCIRLNDFSIIGDGTHRGCFDMIGLFSFRDWTLNQTIDFWNSFICDVLKLKIGYVTVHPDKEEWKKYYSCPLKIDSECKWSDGTIGGYCTEFYINDIEIGNIVNPLGTCIDVGFGLERIDCIVNNIKPKSKLEELIYCCENIIECGVSPSGTGRGYVLRKLIREINNLGGELHHKFFKDELDRQIKICEKYSRLKVKYKDKPPEWWYDTHGININDIPNI